MKTEYNFTKIPTVKFGRYPHTKEGEIKPIEWYKLFEKDGRTLLFSTKVLDCQPYSSPLADVTWETCSLRKWLNDSFFNAAFNDDEQKKIVPVELSNDDTLEFEILIDPATHEEERRIIYETPGGNKTTDRVFLLSLNELAEINREYGGFYFEENDRFNPNPYPETRKCLPTQYAKSVGSRLFYGRDYWLRSAGRFPDHASNVHFFFKVSKDGWKVNERCSIRPAIWVKTEK